MLNNGNCGNYFRFLYRNYILKWCNVSVSPRNFSRYWKLHTYIQAHEQHFFINLLILIRYKVICAQHLTLVKYIFWNTAEKLMFFLYLYCWLTLCCFGFWSLKYWVEIVVTKWSKNWNICSNLLLILILNFIHWHKLQVASLQVNLKKCFAISIIECVMVKEWIRSICPDETIKYLGVTFTNVIKLDKGKLLADFCKNLQLSSI